MPAVPEFHTQWLPTMVLTTGCLEALCGGEEAGEGGAWPVWLEARTIKGLSEKDPLATGYPEEPLRRSHTRNPGSSVFEYLWEGLGMLLTQNLSFKASTACHAHGGWACKGYKDGWGV